MDEIFVGIDLGTTNTLACVMKKGTLKAARNTDRPLKTGQTLWFMSRLLKRWKPNMRLL